MKRLLSMSIILMILVSMVVWVGVSTVEAGGGVKPPTCPPPHPTYDSLIFCQLQEIKSLIQGVDNTCANPTYRRYYLTKDTFDGSQATTACVTGYHMANFFEILNPSGLVYDMTNGYTRDDSGLGPPSSTDGYVRTGYDKSGTSPHIGSSNCNNWTDKTDSWYGTATHLLLNWTASNVPTDTIAPWYEPVLYFCSHPVRVWCIQDAN